MSRLLVITVALAAVTAGLAHWAMGGNDIHEQNGTIRKLASVGTHILSSGKHSSKAPSPISIEWNRDLIQVSGIALGHPRLAVINGKQVAEGETITIHSPTRSVAITLRVLEISDRKVTLSDGTQVMTVHLRTAQQGSP
ncbi:MAG TPA: hypothetical protein VGM62_04375 [Chthoniobacterales bacterium]|jgi:hypothetical protein